ncbi:MAG TPA: hypothetical protein PK185_02135 [Cyclobacteriaceae bacterium]|nr:hypothetical protein [Cyclobacteriaceae bacterium]
MRISQAIFAFYILFLAVYPCSDANSRVIEQKSEIVSALQSTHLSSGMEADICTPFCICACCSAHIKISTLSDLEFSGVIHNTKANMPYLEKRFSSGNSSIWQPPRI